jgi:preprotein translocase subunit SecG|tara:strand:- start:201 stop:512 length:312 start_codon:yes stop_codon:yes gene_type:complete
MIIFLTITSVLLAIVIIGIVLLQQGKGSDLGSAFGGGSSNSMFGALGPSNFLGRLTYIIVAVWLILSFLLAYLLKNENTEVIFETPLIEEAIEEGLSDEIPIE